MPLIEHLRELRNRLVKAALALILAMVIGFVFFHPIWQFVTHPFCSASINGRTGCKTVGDQLVVTGVFDPDRKSTRLNSSHLRTSRMPSSA